MPKTTKTREKISTDLKSLEFQKNFDQCLTKFKNTQILLNKNQPLISTDSQAIYWVKDPNLINSLITFFD